MKYETKDLYLAAFLLASRHALLTTRKNGPEIWFAFEQTPELERDQHGYYSGQASVIATSYAQALRSLKSVIHDGKPKGGP